MRSAIFYSICLILIASMGTRAQSTSSALDLYPMDIGDTWIYDYFALNVARYYATVKITGDSVMPNGLRYFARTETHSKDSTISVTWERIDSNTACVYRWRSYSADEAKTESLLAVTGDYIFPQVPPNSPPIICYRVAVDTLFGDSVLTKSFSVSVTNSYRLAQGFGLVHSYIDDTHGWGANRTLVYSKINGVPRGTPLSVNEEHQHPLAFTLNQNYPNPFNPITRIQFALAQESYVDLVIVNSLGQTISHIFSGVRSAGTHVTYWNARVPSGVYYYRLTVSDVNLSTRKGSITNKMLLIR